MRTGLFHIVLGVCCFAAAGRAAAQDIESAVAQNKGSVLIIDGTVAASGGHSQSSGCCIDPRGYILTTAHQVKGVVDIKGRLEDGTTFGLSIVEILPNSELALLRAEAPLPQSVRIGDAKELSAGMGLFSIATPMYLEFSISVGTVSSTRRTYMNNWAIQADFRVSPGSSGGPVFNNAGHLVGLVIGETTKGSGWTVVNPINNAYALLRRHGIPVPESTVFDDQESVLIPAPGITQTEMRAIDAYNRGVAAFDADEKVNAYGLAVALLPQFYEARFNYAVALTAAGDIEKAQEAYRAASLLRPNAPEPLRNLGRNFLRMKNPEAAVEAFTKAAAVAPDAAQSYNDLGEAYRQAGDLVKASTQFEKALELNPAYADAHFNLGLAYGNTGQGAKAIEHFQTYLRLSPGATDAAQVNAWLEALQKQP